MKNITRKLAALLLVMSMALSMAMPTVLAAELSQAPAETVELFSEELLEIAPEFAQAKLATLTDASEDTLAGAILTGMLNGETVIDVADFAASEEEADKTAAAMLDEVNASELVEASVVVNEDGEAASVLLDVDPRTANVIKLLNELPASASGITTAEDSSDLAGLTVKEKESLLSAYLELVKYKEDNADLFGVDVPYNTYMDTETNPFASLFAQAYLYYDAAERKASDGKTHSGFYWLDKMGLGSSMGGDFVTVTLENGSKEKRQYVDHTTLLIMLTVFDLSNQAGAAAYGEQILAARDTLVKRLTNAEKNAGKALTDAEKMLVINDFVCENVDTDFEFLQSQFCPPAEEKSDYVDPVVSAIKKILDDEIGRYNIPGLADFMLEGVVTLWRTNHIGGLGQGKGIGACFANTFNYLAQCAYPEVYKNAEGKWKKYTEVNYVASEVDGKTVYTPSKNAGYITDTVAATLKNTACELGQFEADPIAADRYWNAVKVNVEGKKGWYYIDSDYNDSYTQSVLFSRVNMPGMETHLLFLYSGADVKNLYGSGSVVSLTSLYEKGSGVDEDQLAGDDRLSHAWFSQIKGRVSVGEDGFYYAYDTTDLLGVMNNTSDLTNLLNITVNYGIARRSFGGKDLDKAVTKLIDFQTTAKGGTKVLNPVTGKTEVNKELTALYEQHLEDAGKFAAINISGGLYGDKYYFNLSNRIMSYDVKTGEVAAVKEYNTVKAKIDRTYVVRGDGASILSGDAKNADIVVENHPLTSMAIQDGKLLTGVATNFSRISHEGWRYLYTDYYPGVSARKSFGYEFEETNYQSSYYDLSDYVQKYPFLKDYLMPNDNMEFEWCMNLKESLSMSELTGSKHSFQKVSVAATCGKNAFTEERCKDCGAIKAGSRVEKAGTALDHHFITSNEIYYTTKDFQPVSTNQDPTKQTWNKGTNYVCARCMTAIQGADWANSGYTADEHVYTKEYHVVWSEDCKSAEVVVDGCEICSKVKLDCTLGLDTSDRAPCVVTAEPHGNQITYVASLAGVTLDAKTVTRDLVVTLSSGSKTYTGKAVKPGSVTVKCDGVTLTAGKDYTVSYKNNVNVGMASVVITGQGSYAGLTVSKNFRVNPKGVSISSAKSDKKSQLTVKWTKNATVTGYQIRYGKKSDFSDAKTVTVKSAKTVSKTLTSLTAGKKYYVSVRTYQKVGSTNYYSAWSGAKNATVKK